MLNVSIVAKRVTILPTAQLQEKMTTNIQTWYQGGFQKPISIFIERHVDQKGEKAKKKENTESDDESLDMNVFEKLMEGKHTKIVNNGDDDLKSITNTNTFSYSKQTNMTDKSCLDNNYNNDYDELADPFSKRIKLKHEREEAQENNPVQ
jgi:hypothetical protein